MWSYISVVLSPPWAKLFVERSSPGPLTVNLSTRSSLPHDIVVSNIARIADLTISEDAQRPFAFQCLSVPAPVLNSFSINNYVSSGGQKLVLPNLIFDGDAPRLTDLRIGPDVLISSELLILRTLKSLEIRTIDISSLISILECCSQLEILTLRRLESTVQQAIRPRQFPIVSLPRLRSLFAQARDIDDAENLLHCIHDNALANLVVFIFSPRIIPHRIQALLRLLASHMRRQKKLTGPLRSLGVLLSSHRSSYSDAAIQYVQFAGWTDPGRDTLPVINPHDYLKLDLSARPHFFFSFGPEVKSTDHFSLACSLSKQFFLLDVQTLTIHIGIHDTALSDREPLHVPQSRWFEMFHSLVSTETLRLKYECFEPFPRPPIEIIRAATPTLGDNLHLVSADNDGLDASAPRYLFPHLKKLIIHTIKNIRLGARLLIDLQLLLETRRDAGTPIEELELEGFRAWSGITSSPLPNLTRLTWDGEVLSSMWDCEEGWLDLLN
ncbi:hypothetical protein EW146_g10070 [Bondarzewia mesenterica]|uniref:F-box domain-containing protein n=1 Tax=Bondarzewia mesenterica TaxID=1095465 RepID=A0A4S4L182_9AGAM|nr:hypothetical protein EW146_g10070 [Bondarzewia mesenterica]